MDYMQVVYIPWDGPYPTQLITTVAGKKEMYIRHCVNGEWDVPQKVITSSNYVLHNTTKIQFNNFGSSDGIGLDFFVNSTDFYRLWLNNGNAVFQKMEGGVQRDIWVK